MRVELDEKLKLVPHRPGCYLWKNKYQEVIYVGKANDLFKRTHQYFDKNRLSSKNKILVSEIYDLDYFVVNSPNEALILENNLVKKYWPKFNILLKDSTEYPYILVTNDIEPKLIYTHKFIKSKGKYYGPLADSRYNSYEIYKFLCEVSPFSKSGPLKNQMSLFLRMYLRKRNELTLLTLDKKELANKWREWINDLFSGQISEISDFIKTLEKQSVERLDFEHAEKYKNLQNALINISNSQIVQSFNKKKIDYFCYWRNDEYLVINVFSYVDGKLLVKQNFINEIFNDIDDEISNLIFQYYSNNKLPDQVFVSIDPTELKILEKNFAIPFHLPSKKIDKEIMEMGIINAQEYLKNNLMSQKQYNERTKHACEELAFLLNLEKASNIEIFDNSNINLEHAVSGMVVFKNGIPSKKDYRKFSMSKVENPSDYAYMKEVIFRRYNSLLEKQISLPDLVIVDGGMIQVNAALASLKELKIEKRLEVIGLKKDDRHRTHSIVLKDGTEVMVDKKSSLFYFLTNMQNEVHRFAISFYKNVHKKVMFHSFLDNIPGIGEKTKNTLLLKYPNINKNSKLTKHELLQFLPPSKANLILNALKKHENNE